MDNIAAAIIATLKDAKLTVRDLAAMANVHFTTIYLIQKKGSGANPLPTVRDSIEQALEKIHSLVGEGKLPFHDKLSQAQRMDKLLELTTTEKSDS